METVKNKPLKQKKILTNKMQNNLPEGSIVIEKKGKRYVAEAVPSEIIKKRRNPAYKYLV